MSKQVEGVQTEEVVVNSNPVEERAKLQGWRPKEEFVESGGSETDWRPAKEFLDRGELFTKIEEVKRENRNLKRTMQQFKEHHEKVEKVAYQKALNDLQRQKKEALIEGDADKVVEIDQAILDHREAAKVAEKTQQEFREEAQAINPVFAAWVERNTWYQYDAEMRTFADSIGVAMKTANPSMTPEMVLVEVEKRVKKAYSEKFKNSRKETAPTVESGGSPRTNKAYAIELTEEEQRAMQKFVKSGALTEEQYIADIKAMRGIK